MTGTRWLDDEEQRAWRAFLHMYGQLTAQLHRQMQTSGLSLADYEVLVRLSDAPHGAARPFELQRGLNWEQSRLSHHLARMQRRGLVERHNCAVDGRGTFIKLTEAGREAITAAAPGHVEAVRRLFFDALTREQLSTLHQVSEQVLDRIRTTASG